MKIKNIMTIVQREWSAYFNSAVAYIFIVVFIMLNCGIFMTQFFLMGRADMRSFFMILPFTLSVFVPAVTMRLWAEEKQGNTFELLLTFPMQAWELVLGKFIAGFLFYLVSLAATVSIPLMLFLLGRPDGGAILGGYLGAAFLGALFLSIGIFVSGLCRDQIVAFILTMISCFGIYLLGTEFIASSIDGWISGFGSLLQNFLGAAPHYHNFTKGVLAVQNFFYFVIGVASFLILNGFWIEGRMRPRAKVVFSTAAVLCFGIFILFNWFLSGASLGRLDISEGKIYTIAPATKQILKSLDAPVTAKFYISPQEKMPTGMKSLEQDIVDKLNEFTSASKGNFRYKIFHMEAANVAMEGSGQKSLEEQLVRKGIQPFQVQSIEADEVGVKLVYSSISISYKNHPEEIIPQIMPDTLFDLEYLLISKIYRATLESLPKVAMVAPFEDKTIDSNMQALLAQLGQGQVDQFRDDPYEVLPLALQYEGYEVSRIQLTEMDPLPEDVEALILLEPKQLSEYQRQEINRFLVEGGSALIGVQNYQFEYEADGVDLELTSIEKKPQINSLLEGWGLQIDTNILGDIQHQVVNISGGAQRGPFAIAVPVKLPIQILIPPSGMNPDLSITSRLSPIFYLWGSAVLLNEDKLEKQGLEVQWLLQSSQRSWTVPFKAGVLKQTDFDVKADSSKGPFPLAVLVKGQFDNLFKDESSKSLTPLPGKLILVGNAMMFQKRLIQGGGHLNFFLNAMDALTLGEELITVRSKQPVDRELGRLSTPTKLFWRIFVTFVIPAFIAAFGATRMIIKKRVKQRYLKSLTH